MKNINMLDCTLRDGGYITKWQFSDSVIKGILHNLTNAGLEFIECGYLNNKPREEGSAIFQNIEQIGSFLPVDRKQALYLAMADVNQFHPEDITPYTGNSIDGIRVVFYKHQVKEALNLCKAVLENGYKLFVQPMVTIDYTIQEYASLSEKIADLNPFGVAIVDSFGYMNKDAFRTYFMVLDNILPASSMIGFHSHNNMDLSFSNAQDVLDYKTKRSLVIDCSLSGMGRGAGNLNTELITNYFNLTFSPRYDTELILDTLDQYIMPIRQKKIWGYSPYLFLTGLYHCHPNFACYLLEKHTISIPQFRKYLQSIPEDMKTKCRPEYVESLYQQLITKEDMRYDKPKDSSDRLA